MIRNLPKSILLNVDFLNEEAYSAAFTDERGAGVIRRARSVWTEERGKRDVCVQ